MRSASGARRSLGAAARDALGSGGSLLAGLLLPRLTLRQRLALRSVRARVTRTRPGWSPPVYDLRLAPIPEPSKRALFSYLAAPFLASRSDSHARDANSWRALEIVRALNEMGYLVDVADCTDVSFVPERTYHLFVGHGGHNFDSIASRLGAEAIKIYYFSGCRWDVHNQRELARLEDLRVRRGVTLPPDRLVTASEADALSIADAFLGVGNEATRRTYSGFDHVHLIPSVVWPDDRGVASSKDFLSGRRHFLFFSGPGNVHKGLDLLLDAFDGLREEHLWICTRIDRPFAAVYGDLLTGRSNIHLLEWVKPRSPLHYDVLRRSNWIILPSCAEGIATSVVESMNHGLIPVVSEACGIDAAESGIQLSTCSVEEIASTVRELSSLGEARCREMSQAASRAASDGHSPHVGARRIREALEAIVAGRKPAPAPDARAGVASIVGPA